MNKIIFIILSVFCVNFVYADKSSGQTGNLTVKVTGIKGTEGVLQFALFNNRSSYQDSDKYVAEEAFDKETITKLNKNGTATIVIKNLAYGEYAFKLFHDRNNSGHLTTALYGTPTEEVGYSNNADGKDGNPRYYLVKFALDEDHKVQNIKMQSFY